jgi:hypothetical protein
LSNCITSPGRSSFQLVIAMYVLTFPPRSIYRICPEWLRPVIELLVHLYTPMYRNNPSIRYQNFEHFATTQASLMCLTMLSDPWYEEGKQVPAHSLQFDLHGSLTMTNDGIHIEGGEIKSSSGGKQALALSRFRYAYATPSFRKSRVAA